MDWRDLVVPCREYYNAEGQPNAAGGCLHIALDDGNLEDYNIDWCIEYARGHGDEAGVKLGQMLRQLTEEQREELYKHYNDYAYGAPGGTIPDMMRALMREAK